MRHVATYMLLLALASASALAQSPDTPAPDPQQPRLQSDPAAPPGTPPPVTAPATTSEDSPPTPAPWLDRMHRHTYDMVWRSSMHIDRMFGSKYDERAYQQITGSISPAVLWDEFDGMSTRLRFNINLPLPRMSERFNAFVGRVDPDEYVTERSQQSGAFHRQYGPRSEDETLLGISYYEPRKGGLRFDAGTGIQLRTPLNPYIKGGLVWEHGSENATMYGIRQTVFWQNTEHAGTTSRFDIQRYFEQSWLVRWTTSGTMSQKSQGVKGYSSLMGLHGLSDRRAIAVALGFDGETDAEVPMRDYGVKAAYRQRLSRDWLVMELRTSLTWPKEEVGAPRKPSWGVGIGFEMLFGTEDFLARPVTF